MTVTVCCSHEQMLTVCIHLKQGSHASWKVLLFLDFQAPESPGKSVWSWIVLDIKA